MDDPQDELGEDEPATVVALLADFYAQTYCRLLGIDLAERELTRPLAAIADALRSSSASRPLDVPGLTQLHEIRRRAGRYRSSASLIQRLRAIRSLTGRLGMLRDADLRLIDLGADDGALVDLILGRGWKRLLVGVDPAVMSTRSWAREDGAAYLVRTLHEAGDIAGHFGLALTSFSLHHIQPGLLIPTLRQLSGLLRPGGALLVLEDDPEAPEDASRGFDRRYACLSPYGRELLLRVNDYWANVVIYRRHYGDQVHGFRTVAGWLELLRHCRFTQVVHRRMGFNHGRLHGVPSCALLVGVGERGAGSKGSLRC